MPAGVSSQTVKRIRRSVRLPHECTRVSEASDEALVARVARGEELALAELYDRFGRVSHGLALRILRDRSLAEDAVQEAFLGIWRAADRFVADRASARTWVLTLVHRRAVDLVRHEQRRRVPSTDASATDESDEASVVEDSALVAHERERVQHALQTLTKEQRDAIELAYYGGLSQSEMADHLGVPLGTIKSRTFAGLTRLREALADPGCATPPSAGPREQVAQLPSR